MNRPSLCNYDSDGCYRPLAAVIGRYRSLLFFVAWALLLGVSLWLIYHPTPHATLDCPVHEAGNPWCDRQ